jgi:hypothetical protein
MRQRQQANQYNTSSHIILFLLISLVILVVFVALSRKAFGLTLRDKVHNFAWTLSPWRDRPTWFGALACTKQRGRRLTSGDEVTWWWQLVVRRCLERTCTIRKDLGNHRDKEMESSTANGLAHRKGGIDGGTTRWQHGGAPVDERCCHTPKFQILECD